MKKKTFSSWLHHQNRRHLSFITAALLIGVVFIASIAAILSGKFRPFASQNPAADAPLKMNHATRVQSGTLKYAIGGANKTATSNELDVTVKAVTRGSFSLQGVEDKLDKLPEVSGQITIVKQGGNIDDVNDIIVRRGVWSSQSRVDASHGKLEVDSDTVRSRADVLNTNYRVIVKPNNFLATAIDNVSNLRSMPELPKSGAGDLNNDNQINGGDFAVLVQEYNQDINDPVNAKDLNKDGKVDGGDFAILVSNYGKTGESY